MKITNGWKYLKKDRDRVNIELRVGVVTVFRLYADGSDRTLGLTLLNFKLSWGLP